MDAFSSSCPASSDDDVEKEDNDDITQDELLEEIEQEIYNLKFPDNFARGFGFCFVLFLSFFFVPFSPFSTLFYNQQPITNNQQTNNQ